MKHWANIGRNFGGTSADKNVSNNIKRAFTKWLLPYEREHYPDEVMSMNGQESVSPTSRRKRPSATTENSEKKPRSNPVKKFEKMPSDSAVPRTEWIHPTMTEAPMAVEATPNQRFLPLEQWSWMWILRPYVSFQHTSESKICILLLPTTTAQELNGMAPTSTPMDVDATVDKRARTESNGTGNIGESKERTPSSADQYTLSLLMNTDRDVASSGIRQLLPNLSVLIKPENSSTTGLCGTVVETALSNERQCDPSPSSSSPVQRSGLLCLLDGGLPPSKE